MNTNFFHLNLNPEQVILYYKGIKQHVKVQTDSGFSLSLPYNLLLDFLTKEGIHGKFKIIYGSDGKLIELKKIADY